MHLAGPADVGAVDRALPAVVRVAEQVEVGEGARRVAGDDVGQDPAGRGDEHRPVGAVGVAGGEQVLGRVRDPGDVEQVALVPAGDAGGLLPVRVVADQVEQVVEHLEAGRQVGRGGGQLA